jgi:hypothetical protein
VLFFLFFFQIVKGLKLAVLAQSVIVFIFLSDCQGLETRRARKKCAFFSL